MKISAGSPRETGGKGETGKGSRSEVRGFPNFEPRTSSRAWRTLEKLADFFSIRSLSDIAVRHEAREGQADARPQASKNRRRICWNTLRLFRGREQRRCLDIVRRSRKVNIGQAPKP